MTTGGPSSPQTGVTPACKDVVAGDQNSELRMPKEDKITLEAEVVEALPDAQFRVKLENDQEILAYVSGKMRKFFIRILPGDRVTIEVSPYDMTKGRITYRH